MAKAPCPRVIFVRHGQTEWSKSGQYTSVTDLELTPFGVKQMANTGKLLIGNGPLQFLKPADLKHIYVSPRTRAKQTVQLLLKEVPEDQKAHFIMKEENDIREWEYGDYEGLKGAQIIELRKKRGLADADKWNIWEYGCENGETWEQIHERVDKVIAEIREIHLDALKKEEACDILVVAHGHILRCFAARWVGRPVHCNPQFMLDAGGVGVLSYQHHNIEEPAVFLTGAFQVPTEELGADL